MDVSNLKSVKQASKTIMQQHDKLDMLFLNAGVSFVYELNEEDPSTLPTSNDGIELVFATNVVGHHLLYRLLEPLLKASSLARVVSTSSLASIAWLPFDRSDKATLIPSTLEELNSGRPSLWMSHVLYGRSKLGQVAWSNALTRRLGKQSTIYVNSATPGAASSEMTLTKNIPTILPQFIKNAIYHASRQVMWSSEEGALTELYLGVATEDLKSNNTRGKYFHPQAVEIDHPHAYDEVLQDNVWNLCEELVKDYLI